MDEFDEDLRDKMEKWFDRIHKISRVNSAALTSIIHMRIHEFFFEYKEVSNKQIIEKTNAEITKNTKLSES